MQQINWRYIFENSNFWAVQVAKEGIKRAREKNKEIITVRCANTPTGVLHIGNANDVIRAYFIAKCIEILGYKARVVFTSDDRDPIRGFPPVICDKEGNLVKFDEKIREEYEKKYDGFPVCKIPDPFKCHSSWSEHFISVYFNELKELGILDSVQFEYYSPNVLYHTGEWEELVKVALDKKDKINEIYKKFKQHVREYPFSVICEKCGRIGTTNVVEYDSEKKEVKYVCGGRHLKKKTVKGCGYEGKTSIRNGKLDWYVEWAIDWVYFDTDIEPMGKDHYTSSWRISPLILKEVFGKDPPIPVPYEFFTINGKKMSGSKGNIWNITEFLKIMEPEVVLYLYTKRPMVERDIDLKNLHLLINEFDSLEERVYRTLEKIEKSELSLEKLKDGKFVEENNLASFEDLVIYYLVTHGKIKKKKPIRVPYNFCAILGQLILPKEFLEKTYKRLVYLLDYFEEKIGKGTIKKTFEKIKLILQRTGFLKEEIEEFELYSIIDRIRKAGYWAKKYGPEYLRIELVKGKIDIQFDEKEREILKKIIEYLKTLEKIDMDKVQTDIHNIIKGGVNPRVFYKKLYKILIGKESGPRIGSLVAAVGKEEIIKILETYV